MKLKLRLGDSYALTKHKLKQFKIRFFSLLAVGMIMCLYAVKQVSAQMAEPAATAVTGSKPLQIGDTIPYALALPTMLHHSTGETSMQAYRGKWLILDFWATYCPACINAMPHLYQLQQQFSDELNILLISSEKREQVKRLLEKSPVARNTHFAFVVQDTVLHKLFPHRIIPHEVWVDPEGVVRAITSHNEVTVANITAMINGTIKSLPQKRDNTGWYFAQRYDEIMADTSVISQSTLRKYISGMPTTGYYAPDSLDGEVRYRHVSFYNQQPISMYYSLFMRCHVNSPTGNLNPYRIAVEVGDEQLRQRFANADLPIPFYPTSFPYAGWATKAQYRNDNYFNYDFTLPAWVPDTVFVKKVFEDLGNKLPIKARVEKKSVDAIVISVSDRQMAAQKLRTPAVGDGLTGNRLDSKSIVINGGTMEDLMKYLGYFRAPLMVDETGIEGVISMRISFDESPHFDERMGLIVNMYPFDLEVFRRELNRYGLDAKIQSRHMDILVITD